MSLLGRFMLVVTWENVLEHVAGASDDLGVKGSWVRIPPSRQCELGIFKLMMYTLDSYC